METFTLLNTKFFHQLEEGDESNITALYADMRATIVEYAHGSSQWRVIHTGLSIFISEVAEILGYADGLLSRYAKRILEIAKCLLNQIEMAVSAKIALDTVTENNQVTDTTSDVTFTGNYADFCELIHLIIACKFINGGSKAFQLHIKKELHSLFGLDFDPKKYQNARDGIKRRCPAKGSRVTYFLDNMVDVVNAELAA